MLEGKASCRKQYLESYRGNRYDKDPKMKYFERKVCKCCQIVIAWKDWHWHDSGGRYYGLASATLHIGKSCKEVKQTPQLRSHIENGGYRHVYEDY